MFRTTRRLITTATAAAALLAPAAAGAADRPLPQPIVEWGGVGHSSEVFVHGTHGHNNFVIDKAESFVLVRSLTGEKISAGARCAWNDKWRAVACPTPYKVNVHLHGANDEVRLTEAARQSFNSEAWGGQGNDVLRAGGGHRASVLLGGDDHDVLVGSSGREGLFGGPGNDTIYPGGGMDHVDGGHGAFSGAPYIRDFERNDGECAARTHGPWDRLYGNFDGPEGVDTMNLSNLPHGALADINICRLGFFGTEQAGLVHAIENVVGTPHNDRLVGDGEANVLTGGGGSDWMSGEGGADRLRALDGTPDTVRCGDAEDAYELDSVDRREGC